LDKKLKSKKTKFDITINNTVYTIDLIAMSQVQMNDPLKHRRMWHATEAAIARASSKVDAKNKPKISGNVRNGDDPMQQQRLANINNQKDNSMADFFNQPIYTFDVTVKSLFFMVLVTAIICMLL
jgi:hypothetical protein